MNTEKIVIANLKCPGCEHTIKAKIAAIEGVSEVTVQHEDDSVTVTFNEPASRALITNQLYSLGYPEATEENGLLLQLKSYASCMIGRVNK